MQLGRSFLAFVCFEKIIGEIQAYLRCASEPQAIIALERKQSCCVIERFPTMFDGEVQSPLQRVQLTHRAMRRNQTLAKGYVAPARFE